MKKSTSSSRKGFSVSSVVRRLLFMMFRNEGFSFWYCLGSNGCEISMFVLAWWSALAGGGVLLLGVTTKVSILFRVFMVGKRHGKYYGACLSVWGKKEMDFILERG